MKIIFNSSPLIFLVKLDYLNQFIESNDGFYIPQSVADEINTKQDIASQKLQNLLRFGKLQVQPSHLTRLINSLNQRLGIGESEAIALGIEINADYILLDDAAARREARRLGLNIKGTLAIIKKLWRQGEISIDSLDTLYEELTTINFRVKRSLFEQIFSY